MDFYLWKKPKPLFSKLTRCLRLPYGNESGVSHLTHLNKFYLSQYVELKKERTDEPSLWFSSATHVREADGAMISSLMLTMI